MSSEDQQIKLSLEETVDILNEDPEPANDEDEDAKNSIVGRSGVTWVKGALLGTGSFGSVFLGMDATTGHLMAVRQIQLPQPSNEPLIGSISSEIDKLRELQHENLVQVLDWSHDDDGHFNIFVEYAHGGSIAQLLQKYGHFEEPLTKTFAKQILAVLSFLHGQGIAHGYLTSNKVLVSSDGKAKLSALGLDRIRTLVHEEVEDVDGSQPQNRESLRWSAPETIDQNMPSVKADIWSFGCIVLEMLSGSQPYTGDELKDIESKLRAGEGPTIQDDIPQPAATFIRQVMNVNPESRPDANSLLEHIWFTTDAGFPKAEEEEEAQNLDVPIEESAV